MDFSTYQKEADAFRNTQLSREERLFMLGFGLGGETGEVLDVLKKHKFHGHPLDKTALRKELGDALWYLTGLATYFGWQLDTIAEENIQKLSKRYASGAFSEQASQERSE